MDKVDRYRSIVKRILAQYAEETPSVGQVETVPVFDDQSGQYMVVDMGWDPTGRVHAVILHLHLKHGKIWVEVDGIEEGVTRELLAAGIPKEDIVLAFYRPERRRLTEFAAM